ncbi:MAG TPA: aldo/keto reductase [Candidatus Polarisedimenticolia bacterium]|nr:aldo/keto reductase [Candidatus Polarisedimenticolia bacterium]
MNTANVQEGAARGPGGLRQGRATPHGTARYASRFAGSVHAGHFRAAPGGLILSSIGIGTYLGEPDDADDRLYRDAVVAAVRSGCNVIDTAVNYRCQRSERSIGQALSELMGAGGEGEFFSREEVVVATKGGFIPFDGGFPARPAEWFRSALLAPGIASPQDVVADCHIMTPRYLDAQIEWSRRNLGLETLDIYYLHNPETQLQEVRRDEFLVRLRAAFELLEQKVAAGAIGVYGVATWDGLRLPPDHPGHLSLRELLGAAEQAGGRSHHFKAIQLPVNLAMGEASLDANQMSGARRVSLLEAASEAGLTVMASGSLLQGQVISALPPSFGDHVQGLRTSAQRGLQVVRSVPGVACALVGMKQLDHVRENLGVAAIPPMAGEEARRLLQACRSPRR